MKLGQILHIIQQQKLLLRDMKMIKLLNLNAKTSHMEIQLGYNN